MSNFIYSAMSGKSDPMFGKFQHPIKAFIEDESNICEKEKNILDFLFNVAKSNRYAETVMGESDFETFRPIKEGQGAVIDSVEKTFHKTIEHIEFMKEFYITKKMADDSKFGIGADMENKPRKFTRAYYKTRVQIAAQALIHGTATSMNYNGQVVDLATGDEKALFASDHPFALEKFSGKSQSNFFYGDLTSTAAKFEEALGVLSNKMRNFKDENNESLGYVADVIVLPCNRPHFEMMAKKAVGSERTVGSDHNDINTQYGNWSICVLPGWETTDDRFMIMSTAANKNLLGNMFYNRKPLDIRSYIDEHTRNNVWNGYCRFGVGFNTWKHMALAVNSSAEVDGATALAD